MIKKLTVTEYAELRGITVQAVRQSIKRGANMLGVIATGKFGVKNHSITARVSKDGNTLISEDLAFEDFKKREMKTAINGGDKAYSANAKGKTLYAPHPKTLFHKYEIEMAK